MIGVSIHRNEITYLQSSRKKDDFSVLNHGNIKYTNYDKIITDVVADISNLDSINKKDKNISFVIDSELCLFNEVFCEDEKSLDFHNELSGSNGVLDYMDSYYYPINSRDDHYLGIHINKNIKAGLVESVKTSSYSLRSIGIGLFSAEMMARNAFGAHALDNYLVIRFITSNSVELLYMDDGILILYGKYKISGNSIHPIKTIGNKKQSDEIISFLNHLTKANRINTKKINKVFIYQSSGQSPIVKKLISKKSKDVALLNLFNYDASNGSNKAVSKVFAHLKFAEHGQLFRGLNV